MPPDGGESHDGGDGDGDALAYWRSRDACVTSLNGGGGDPERRRRRMWTHWTRGPASRDSGLTSPVAPS